LLSDKKYLWVSEKIKLQQIIHELKIRRTEWRGIAGKKVGGRAGAVTGCTIKTKNHSCRDLMKKQSVIYFLYGELSKTPPPPHSIYGAFLMSHYAEFQKWYSF
jgi:hypothetical protein